MKLTMTGTGDSILIQGYQEGGYPGFAAVRDYICRGQARFGNLETCITKWDTYCSAYSGGTWMNAEPRVLPQILDYGFNFLGFANNHTMDLGPDGLLETVANVKKTGVAITGAGADLGEASQPVYRDFPGGRVAFIAISASFNDAARAGYTSKTIKGRPGVNALRHKKEVILNREHFDQLTAIAAATKMNGSADISRKNGFRPALPEGVADFDGMTLRLSEEEKEGTRTTCNKRDLERTLDAIKDARIVADYVVIMFHCHDIPGDDMTEPTQYAREFCHAVIDGGADVVFGGGTHEFKPIEIYQGKPIFHSLGNFCFQSNVVVHQPADMLEKYGLDEMSGASALAKRNKDWTIGHHTQPENFRSAIPYLEFEDGKLVAAELMPIELGFHKPRSFKGVPYPADAAQAKEIFDILKGLSAPYGTELEQEENGIIRILL